MNDSADSGLASIAQVAALLEANGIEYWIFGGWAVDFAVGEVTRPHHDVDLVVWLADRDAVQVTLTGQGWRPTPVGDPAIAAAYSNGLCLLEFTFVVPADGGGVALPFATGDVPWWPTDLGEERRALFGVTARTVPLALTLQDKSSSRGDAADQLKDAADLAVLRSAGLTADRPGTV